MKRKVLDLFSGIGGFSLGLERTGGFRTVAFCEVEPYCRAVLAKHWPGVPIHGDVRQLHAFDDVQAALALTQLQRLDFFDGAPEEGDTRALAQLQRRIRDLLPSHGGPAALAPAGYRPVALRPGLSTGLPFSKGGRECIPLQNPAVLAKLYQPQE